MSKTLEIDKTSERKPACKNRSRRLTSRPRRTAGSRTREEWEILRDQIALGLSGFMLSCFVATCAYILTHPDLFPREITTSAGMVVGLSSFAFIGHITKTPSISHAVARAIENGFGRIKGGKRGTG